MRLFVDTSALLALGNVRERTHLAARSVLERILDEDLEVLTSGYVVEEAFVLLQRRLGLEHALHFETSLRRLLDVTWVDEDLHLQSVEIVRARARRRLSLVDASAFVVMRRLGIGHAFAYDADFEREGFQLVRDEAELNAFLEATSPPRR